LANSCGVATANVSTLVSHAKAVRESTAQSFAEHHPVLDWIIELQALCTRSSWGLGPKIRFVAPTLYGFKDPITLPYQT